MITNQKISIKIKRIKKRAKSQKIKNTVKIDSTKIKNNNNSKYNDSESEKDILEDITDNVQLQDLIKSKIFYLELNNENKEFYKYSLSKAYWNIFTINYKCSDSLCDSRLSAKIEKLIIII